MSAEVKREIRMLGSVQGRKCLCNLNNQLGGFPLLFELSLGMNNTSVAL